MKCVRLLTPIAAITAAMFFTGCTENLTGNEKHETAPTTVKIAFQKNSPIQKVAYRGELYVVGDDFDTLWGDARVDSSGFSGELTKIPVGKNRTFGVSIYDSLNMLRYHGEDVASIHAGTNDPLFISLNRVTQTGTIVVIGEVNEGTEPITNITWLGELAAHPVNPEIYWGYYNTTDGKVYMYNGTEWEIIEDLIPEAPKMKWLGSYSDAPEMPEVNSAYYNITAGLSYIFDGHTWSIFSFSDATQVGISGISINWMGSYSSSPMDPAKSWAYYNTTEKVTYRFNGREWEVIARDDVDPVDQIIIDTIFSYDTIQVSDTTYLLNGVELSPAMSSIPWLGVLYTFPNDVPEGSVFYHYGHGLGYNYNGYEWSAYTDDEFLQDISYRYIVEENVQYDTLRPTVCLEK